MVAQACPSIPREEHNESMHTFLCTVRVPALNKAALTLIFNFVHVGCLFTSLQRLVQNACQALSFYSKRELKLYGIGLTLIRLGVRCERNISIKAEAFKQTCCTDTSNLTALLLSILSNLELLRRYTPSVENRGLILPP